MRKLRMFKQISKKNCKTNSEGICMFGEDCSYKHEKDSNKDLNVQNIKEQHAKEVKSLKDEMSKIQETIFFIQNQITALNEEIQKSKKMDIS